MKKLLLLLFLASLWGPSFLFIKIAVAEIPPVTVAALRIFIGALSMLIFLFAKKQSFPSGTQFWKNVAIAGFLAHALPFVLISWGEVYVDSALAAVLNGITPLFTIVLAAIFIVDEKLTLEKIFGIVVGFAGLIILMWPKFDGEIEGAAWGVVAISIATASYGAAMVFSRRKLMNVQAGVAPTAQLLITSVYLLPFALWVESPLSQPIPGPAAITSILILGVFGTAVAFVVYYKILEVANASYLSLVTYLMPVFGVILGYIVLDETLSVYSVIGTFFIFSGVMVVNKTIRLKKLYKFSILSQK